MTSNRRSALPMLCSGSLPIDEIKMMKQFVAMLGLLLATSSISSAQLRFPSEGRWSIATGWEADWPSNWQHVSASRTEQSGEWTMHYGLLELGQGHWELRDATRAHPILEGVTELRRRWHWKGKEALDRVTLSIRQQLQANSVRPFMPGISYYDNPAGQKVDSRCVPVIGSQVGGRGYYEEHRYPMPFAALEAEHGGSLTACALHSVPSPLKQGNRDDQWWSLGVENISESVTELALLSGATASNGRDSVIKAMQRQFVPYRDAWLTVPPGTIIEKTVYIQDSYQVERRGNGFRPALWTSAALFEPYTLDGFPSFRETIALKFRETLNRWHEDAVCAGVDAFPDTGGRVRAWIDLGWAGQSEALAYPLLLIGDEFELLEDSVEMAQKAVDFIATSPFAEGGFSIRYDFEKHEWLQRTNPLSQGQTMNNLLNALRIAKKRNDVNVTKWESFLKRAAEFHADIVLKPDWNPVSTNAGFLIAPLAQAGGIFAEAKFLRAARKAADHYGKRHLSMDEPYWGGTLDARCEDKEGAWAALLGFLTMHEVTGESKYLDWAAHAADVVVSYVYVWDVPLPPGRLADNAFKTRGWTSVSAQNMHLDVYGVLCAPALWRLGELTGREEYQKMSRLMVVACGQMVDPTGSQGEQLHQTNYAQHYAVTEDLDGVRGDYVESWNVYWIAAHFLTAAAQFEEMGVEWREW